MMMRSAFIKINKVQRVTKVIGQLPLIKLIGLMKNKHKEMQMNNCQAIAKNISHLYFIHS
jgi:hypothetical protein